MTTLLDKLTLFVFALFSPRILTANVLSALIMRRNRIGRLRTAQAGGFFSENFLMLALFSIPVAYIFYLLGGFLFDYSTVNIFTCFSDTGSSCFNNQDYSGELDGRNP